MPEFHPGVADRLWGCDTPVPRTQVGCAVPDLLRHLLQRAFQQVHDASDDIGFLQQLLIHHILHEVDAHALLPGGEGQECGTLPRTCAASKYPQHAQKPDLETLHEHSPLFGLFDFCLFGRWLALPDWLIFKTGSSCVSQASL